MSMADSSGEPDWFYKMMARTASTFSSYNLTPEYTLDQMDIKDIEKYLRKKKIQNLKKETDESEM